MRTFQAAVSLPVDDADRAGRVMQDSQGHRAGHSGDRACKLKKPASLGFVYFTTQQARAAACAREVELDCLPGLVSDPFSAPARGRGLLVASSTVLPPPA
jgi:hypothetical protein